jgi:hypothetical protein
MRAESSESPPSKSEPSICTSRSFQNSAVLLMGGLCVIIIVVIAAIVLFAVSLVLPNASFVFATVLAIIFIITSIFAAILPPCVSDNEVAVGEGCRYAWKIASCDCYATCKAQNSCSYHSG